VTRSANSLCRPTPGTQAQSEKSEPATISTQAHHADNFKYSFREYPVVTTFRALLIMSLPCYRGKPAGLEVPGSGSFPRRTSASSKLLCASV
jgi:hypothetical protein